jgi:preprotein translocase subunit SecY
MIGGTSLLIAVSVILETARQINAQLQMREYETF